MNSNEWTYAIVTLVVGLVVFCLAVKKVNKRAEIVIHNTVTREFVVTAYCPCDLCTNGDGITASGHTIQSGDKFCAASRDFEFYDKVIIPGYNNNKPTPILDRGQSIQGDVLDVYFDTHIQALMWGHQTLQVTIHK